MEQMVRFGKTVNSNVNYTRVLAYRLNIQTHQYGSLNMWVNRYCKHQMCMCVCVFSS